jgi:hypothetical protein
MTPTQRSLALLDKQGYTARVVEHWNHYAKVRQDLYGFIDIVALHPERQGVLGVQTTTAGNITARINKALLIPACKLWLECGNQIEFHGWEKLGGRWQLEKREFIRAADGQILIWSL